MVVAGDLRRRALSADKRHWETCRPIWLFWGFPAKGERQKAAIQAKANQHRQALGSRKHPQAFFAGMVAMSKVIRWETGADAASFSCTMTPEEIMDKLEERVGPEGRKLFEQFLRKVNKLQAQQQLEVQAQMGVGAPAHWRRGR
jgi:hypothetical protein